MAINAREKGQAEYADRLTEQAADFLDAAKAAESADAQQQQQPARSFGADDQTRCPKCGMTMTLTRRTPDSEHGDAYERQTFTCLDCGHNFERSVDTHGKPYK